MIMLFRSLFRKRMPMQAFNVLIPLWAQMSNLDCRKLALKLFIITSQEQVAHF